MPLSPSTLGVARLLSRLGIKGGSLPRVNTDEYVATLLMGDFSKTLTSEPIETRAIAAQNVVAGGGNRAFVECVSRAPGGVVIEEFLGLFLGGSGGHLNVVRPTNPPAFPLTNVADNLNIGGGEPASSIVNIDRINVDVLSVPGQFAQLPQLSLGRAGGVRAFLPPGQSLVFQRSTSASVDGFGIVFRELAQGIGPP